MCITVNIAPLLNHFILFHLLPKNKVSGKNPTCQVSSLFTYFWVNCYSPLPLPTGVHRSAARPYYSVYDRMAYSSTMWSIVNPSTELILGLWERDASKSCNDLQFEDTADMKINIESVSSICLSSISIMTVGDIFHILIGVLLILSEFLLIKANSLFIYFAVMLTNRWKFNVL